MSREMEQGEGSGNEPIYATQTQHFALQHGTQQAMVRLEEHTDSKLTSLEEHLNNFEAIRMELARMGRQHRHSSSSSASGFGSSSSSRSRRPNPHNRSVDDPHVRQDHSHGASHRSRHSHNDDVIPRQQHQYHHAQGNPHQHAKHANSNHVVDQAELERQRSHHDENLESQRREAHIQ